MTLFTSDLPQMSNPRLCKGEDSRSPAMQSQLIPGDGPAPVVIPVITAACGKSVRISTVSQLIPGDGRATGEIPVIAVVGVTSRVTHCLTLSGSRPSSPARGHRPGPGRGGADPRRPASARD